MYRHSVIKLRGFIPSDVEFVLDAVRSADISRLARLDEASTFEDGLAFVRRQAARYEDKVGASFVIEDESAVAVGQVGVYLDYDERASMGYWTVPRARGRGFAATAVEVAARWAIESFDLARVELYVEPENLASMRVAEKAGFTNEGLLRSWRTVGDQRKDMFMFSLLRTDLLQVGGLSESTVQIDPTA